MRVFSRFLSTFLILCTFFVADVSYGSSISDYIVGYEDKLTPYDVGPGARVIHYDERGGIVKQNIYEDPTNKALSLLYWAVDLYKLEDDKAIDLFVFTNECDIYKKYNNDQIEWEGVRDATRQYLAANKEDFPTSFEFEIPLLMDEYDNRKGTFLIREEFQISSVRRFEVFSSNFTAVPCIDIVSKAKIYPRAVVLEFSRPLTLIGVPMSYDVAKSYIKRKLDIARAKTYAGDPHENTVRKTRTALLVLKVKIFTHGRFLGVNHYDLDSVQMLAVLEGYDVYDDQSRERLLYSQNYVSNSSNKIIFLGLKEQIEILKEKAAGKGMLH